MGNRRETSTRSRSLRWWLIGGAVIVASTALLVAVRLPGSASSPTGSVSSPTNDASSPAVVSVARVARRETRPTLDPARFVGKARQTHQIARDIPDTLDQLYCYCQCDKSVGHKSLLSCYTDGHAAT